MTVLQNVNKKNLIFFVDFNPFETIYHCVGAMKLQLGAVASYLLQENTNVG
jgi:hypothetical protein